jgi:hypothetical protein
VLDLTDGDTTSHAYSTEIERIPLTDVSPYLQGHSAFYYDFNKNKYQFTSNVFAFASFKIKTSTMHYFDCDRPKSFTDKFCDTCWVKRQRDKRGCRLNDLHCDTRNGLKKYWFW